MHVTTLIGRLRQSLAQCRSEPGVVIGHHEFDAVETTRLEPQQKIPPARSTLAVGELDRKNLAPAVPVDADRDQHRLARDDAGLAHPLVARVRSEEHTSELQSRGHLVCRLLLEKKKITVVSIVKRNNKKMIVYSHVRLSW